MNNEPTVESKDVASFFERQSEKTLLRFLTCGSVDDGKSTLIGRLLHDSHQIYDDHLAELRRESTALNTQVSTGQNIDFALLMDGLASEREQGITIDVAYRFFSTETRKFIVADTPGHEQYTRNMATGASTSDLAVLLVDARNSLSQQTKRHTLIVSLLGIEHIVLCVNKLDLVNFDQKIFDDIKAEFTEFSNTLRPFSSITTIPVSALNGDNVANQSKNMGWYKGPTLLAHLENIEIQQHLTDAPLRLPVQWVNRSNSNFRGFCGQCASGTLQVGEDIRVIPSGKTSKIKEIFIGEEKLDQAVAGQSIMVTLEDEIDVSRGSFLCSKHTPCLSADQFEVSILWMDDQPLLKGRRYILKAPGGQLQTSITRIKHKIDINSGAKLAASKICNNEIGICNISCSGDIPFDPYEENKTTGAFILIDRMTNATVALGTIHFALRRAENIHRHPTQISRRDRQELKGHSAAVLWFTGLSGAGKSTIADAVEQKLHEKGVHTMMLDGDNVRHGLNRDLGFTDADRVENIRRITEVSRLTFDAGLIAMVSFISPFRAERQMARQIVQKDVQRKSFIEIFIDVPLEIAEERDVKGLYAKARRGEIDNFTGISSPYEAPKNPEIRIKSAEMSVDEAANRIIEYLNTQGLLI